MDRPRSRPKALRLIWWCQLLGRRAGSSLNCTLGDVGRALILLGVVALAACATAQAQTFRIVVVPGLELEDLRPFAAAGAAVGLLVPANGPKTSGLQARAALVRGAVESSYLGGIPEGPPKVSFVESRPRGATLGDQPASRPFILLGLPQGGSQANDERYPIAVIAPGYGGLLTSDSTRIGGLVSITDVAPTALGEGGALGSRPEKDAAGAVLALDRRIAAKTDARLASALVAGAVVIGFVLLLPELGPLSFAAGLAGNLIVGAAGIEELWAILLVVGSTAAIGTFLLARVTRSPSALGLVFAGAIAAYLGAMAADPSTVALSPWGAPQNGRFFGVSNELETMLLVPAFAGAALLWRRFGPAGFAAVALLAFVMIAGNRFGADGGGAIVLGVGYAVLAVALAGGTRRAALAALAGAAALVLVLVGIDAATGGSSHVTRALSGGPGEVAGDVGRRLHLSWERATSGWGPGLVVAGCIAGLVVLLAGFVRRPPAQVEPAVPFAVAAALLASFVVNDSPNDVAAVGLVAFAAVARARLAPDAAAPRFRSALRHVGGGARRGRLRRREDGSTPA